MNIVDRIRNARAISAMCLLALGWELNASAKAKAKADIIRSGEETFKINLGGIINNSNTSLRLDGYMITRHFGRSIGYSLADLKVDVDKGDFRGQVNWRMTSLFGYAQARF